VGYK
jgi:Ca2+-binding RTX toxin-like protein